MLAWTWDLLRCGSGDSVTEGACAPYLLRGWAVTTGKACPAGLSDLQKYTNQKGTIDGWGNELVMFCGDETPKDATDGFAILSTGPDGNQGTDDDIKSWD